MSIETIEGVLKDARSLEELREKRALLMKEFPKNTLEILSEFQKQSKRFIKITTNDLVFFEPKVNVGLASNSIGAIYDEKSNILNVLVRESKFEVNKISGNMPGFIEVSVDGDKIVIEV